MNEIQYPMKWKYGRLVWPEIPGGWNTNRITRVFEVCGILSVQDQQKLRVEQCSASFDGKRYGLAKCRIGQCAKLGGGGHGKGQKPYELWLVWT